jgi:hypothetical protein
MKALLTVFLLSSIGLSWASLDADRAAWGVRALHRALSSEGSERAARLQAREIKEQFDAGDPGAIFMVGMYHFSKLVLYPAHLREALERELGPPDSLAALEYLRMATEGGHQFAGWSYWNRVGWPSRDSLMSRVRAGYGVAASKLIMDLAENTCIVERETFDDLRQASLSLGPDSVRSWQGSAPAGYVVVHPGEQIRSDLTRLEEYRQQNCPPAIR